MHRECKLAFCVEKVSMENKSLISTGALFRLALIFQKKWAGEGNPSLYIKINASERACPTAPCSVTASPSPGRAVLQRGEEPPRVRARNMDPGSWELFWRLVCTCQGCCHASTTHASQCDGCFALQSPAKAHACWWTTLRNLCSYLFNHSRVLVFIGSC